MQQQLTLNFGLTKIFFLIYRTLSMRQKTKNNPNQGSNAKKNFFLVLFPSPLPRWVRLVQKTRAKNSHAWAPLIKPILDKKKDSIELFSCCSLINRDMLNFDTFFAI
jgi:hypothetical protein